MNPMKFFWGLVSLGIGILLLGTNLSWWSANVWEVLWYLWPVIIIVLGLRFIIGNDKIFMVLAVLVVLTGGYLAVRNPAGLWRRLGADVQQSTENFTQSVSLGEVEKLNLKFNLGASNVDFSNLTVEESNNSLYQIEASNYGILTPKKMTNGKEVTIDFTEEMNEMHFWGRMNKRELKAKISQLPKLFLEINSGASKFEGDFSNLNLQKLDFRTGASEIDVKLGEIAELLEASFEVGASSIELSVPKNVGLRVEFESEDGLNNFKYSDGFNFSKNDHTYTAQGYETAAKKINLRLAAGVSEIRINQY